MAEFTKEDHGKLIEFFDKFHHMGCHLLDLVPKDDINVLLAYSKLCYALGEFCEAMRDYKHDHN